MNLNYVYCIFTHFQKGNCEFDGFWFGEFSLMVTAVGSGMGVLIDL
jgi:hypothetical protein